MPDPHIEVGDRVRVHVAAITSASTTGFGSPVELSAFDVRGTVTRIYQGTLIIHCDDGLERWRDPEKVERA